MAFSSLFFILVFLPVFLIVYRLAGTLEGKNRVLLVFSLIFYAFGGLRYLALVLVMTFLGWLLGRRIAFDETDRQAKRDLAVAVVLFLAVLAVFKYTGFLIGSLDRLPGVEIPVPEIALPLGISFYIFKLISYVADVYHGRCDAEPRYDRLLLYTVCFHHVTQGPIVRYGDIGPQLEERRITTAGMARGVYRFCIGLGKKVILADYCGQMADVLFPASAELAEMPVLSLWLGSLFYTLQIYLDFSAYCDMAIGLGQMCGFRYAENFNYPYMAVSVRDFWRRWHITLSQFFRDYVYIPMGGSRVSRGRLVLNLLTVWALTGLWHGSSWNFILWGLYYWIFVMIEQMVKKRREAAEEVRYRPAVRSMDDPYERDDRGGNDSYAVREDGHREYLNAGREEQKPVPHGAPRWAGHLYALVVIHFGWVLFRFSDFGQLGMALRGMFGGNGTGLADASLSLTFRNNVFFLIYAVLACTPVFRDLGEWFRRFAEGQSGSGRRRRMTFYYSVRTVIALVLLVWAIFGMAGNTYTPFLYNQF